MIIVGLHFMSVECECLYVIPGVFDLQMLRRRVIFGGIFQEKISASYDTENTVR